MKKSKEGSGKRLGEGGTEEVTLRRRELAPMPTMTPSPYNFMRRSCTFVAESSLGLRKSATRISLSGQPPSLRPPLKTNNIPAANKVVKDRKNLAMQVRQKKEQLEESVDGKHDRSVPGNVSGGSGRMSRLVGGLRAWSSTEDVRQSFMGAIGRTVSVMKQRPGRRAKQTNLGGRPEPNKLETISANGTTKSGTTKPGVTKSSTNKVETNKISTRLNNAKNATNKSQIKPPSERSSFGKTSKTDKTQQQQGKNVSAKTQVGKNAFGRPKSTPASNLPQATDTTDSSSGWFRHIQEAQDAYTAREGRNRRPQPPVSLPDPDDQPASSADALRDVDDAVDIDGGDGADGSNDVSADSKALHGSSKTQDQTPKSEESFTSTSTAGQTPSSPDTLSKKTEHLRRKDLKIRQALEEKQHIIADILNIPHEHFENVVDMAGEPAVGNKEPRELVLAAMFQAKCLQETLNEALNIGEGDIVAARANNDGANKASNLPLYQAPMTKLMSISTSLSQQFASLLSLISERDDERERMRKELVALREQLHLLHMRQNSNQPTSTTTSVSQPIVASPHTSRPSSFVSVASSTADHSDTPDHHDTDEENRNDVPKVNSLPPTECEDSKDDVVPETFEDAVSGGEQTEAASRETEASTGGGGGQGCSEGIGSRESESNTEVTTTT